VLAYVKSTRWCTSSLFSICYFENVCSFVLRLLCAPLCVPLPWSCVPSIELVFLVQVILKCNRMLKCNTGIMKIRLFFILLDAGYMISEMYKTYKNAVNYWTEILNWMLNIPLTLAMCHLLFRGHDGSFYSKRYHNKNVSYNCRRELLREYLLVNYLQKCRHQQRLVSSIFTLGLTVQHVRHVKRNTWCKQSLALSVLGFQNLFNCNVSSRSPTGPVS
jgi:hypothetical protein